MFGEASAVATAADGFGWDAVEKIGFVVEIDVVEMSWDVVSAGMARRAVGGNWALVGDSGPWVGGRDGGGSHGCEGARG